MLPKDFHPKLPPAPSSTFKILADGGSRGNPGPAAAGAVLFNPQRQIVATTKKFLGYGTNNQAEYMGVWLGLALAQRQAVQHLEIFLDSKLVVEQLKGNYKIKNSKLRELAQQVRQKLATFSSYRLQHIPRAQNSLADFLVNEALDAATL